MYGGKHLRKQVGSHNVADKDIFVQEKLVDKRTLFAKMLDFYMETQYKTDLDVASYLNVPLLKVIDMRTSEDIFGIITKEMAYKLDRYFKLPDGYFLEQIKQSFKKIA